MDRGFVKLWRKLRDNPAWGEPATLSVFLYCLIHSEWEPGRKKVLKGSQIELKPGQLTAGRQQISKEMGLSEQNVRTALSRLAHTYNILTIQPTNKMSLITILNWQTYQNCENKLTSKSTSDQPAGNQRVTTPVEMKNSRIEAKTIGADWFEQIWSQYPKKDGRRAAERHFVASVKTEEDFEKIRRALKNYLTSDAVRKAELRYVKNGSTWFANWQDWIVNPVSAPAKPNRMVKCPVPGCKAQQMPEPDFLAHRLDCEARFRAENSGPRPKEIQDMIDIACGRKPAAVVPETGKD